MPPELLSVDSLEWILILGSMLIGNSENVLVKFSISMRTFFNFSLLTPILLSSFFVAVLIEETVSSPIHMKGIILQLMISSLFLVVQLHKRIKFFICCIEFV